MKTTSMRRSLLLAALVAVPWAAVGCESAAVDPRPAQALPAGVRRPVAATPRRPSPEEAGKLVVVARMDEHPRAVHRDPAHAHKRAFEVALARELARRLLGDEHALELRTDVRRIDHIAELTEGRADLAISGVPATVWNETLGVAFSQPYATTGLAVLVAADGGQVSFPTIDAMRGKRFAATTSEEGRFLGAELEALAEQHDVALTVVVRNTTEQALQALADGRVDGLLTLSVTGRILASQSLGALRLVEGPFPLEPCAVVMKDGQGELLAEVNETIRELLSTGRLQQLAREAGFPLENLPRLER